MFTGLRIAPRKRRGRGKAPFTSHDHEVGPSHRRTPSITMSTSPQEPWRTYIEPGRRFVSLSSSPSYLHSFGPQSENEPNNPQPSFIPLQRSNSHHSFGDPTLAFQSRFNPANYIQEPGGFNPLGPEDHFSGDNDMDEDTDPVEPATGTPNHPIEISDGSSFHGSPYRGPDSYQARFNQLEWYFTPSEHSSPYQQQDPSEDSPFVAVTPPPPPPVQQPPPEPPRRHRSNARMCVRGGVRISTPQLSSGSRYPPLQEEDPQMGGHQTLSRRQTLLLWHHHWVLITQSLHMPVQRHITHSSYRATTATTMPMWTRTRRHGTTMLVTLKGPMVVLGPLGTHLMCTSTRHLLNLCISSRRSRN
ncbi:hypothetical protein HanRHA438_Chr15g0729371 [Helianthus annuus]|nr:hypothetical protein HanHA300_Chr15g0584861 [Helianthus annuus]KAJ0474867.1 hypothetical protein HanHA89_Chr15g0634641 [Helianthus annuus]KAJ0650423.1 hypothetical protein HanLR1_Chr15g0595571 [Helianthus annuus]KAJ0846832.1 hypothetical protein HanRHA438_Chr15g0729371 [Helianthus annuus]